MCACVCVCRLGHQTACHVGDHTCVSDQARSHPQATCHLGFHTFPVVSIPLALQDLRSPEVLVLYPQHPCPSSPKALPLHSPEA